MIISVTHAGSGSNSKSPARGLTGSNKAIAATAREAMIKPAEGLLFQSAIRDRMTKSTANSVSSDSTNHAVRKTLGASSMIHSSRPNKARSKITLISPKKIIALRIMESSKRCGANAHAGSTVSPESAADGISDRKLFNKIWDGSNGRNGSTREINPILTMFPKFALVVLKTYFMVLAKVLRPSSIPLQISASSFFNKTKSEASRATSTALCTDTPTSAVCRASASLTPSPRNPTTASLRWSARTIRSFWLGSTSAKTDVAAAAWVNA